MLQVIIDATARIGREYMEVEIAGSGSTMRERVYCYELYHQMRIGLGARRLVLHAEVDKRGHPSFGREWMPNPDFILHVPGSHRRNIAAMEVECRPTRSHLRKDIRTLKGMSSKGYRQLILLLFGVAVVPWDVIESESEAQNFDLSQLQVLYHHEPGSPASIVRP